MGATRSGRRGSEQDERAIVCYKRASTLGQGASRRPRGGGTMAVLSGFPGVPAQKPGRRSLPLERPEGLSLALPKAVPVGHAQARCARWSRGRATAPLKRNSERGRTRTVACVTGRIMPWAWCHNVVKFGAAIRSWTPLTAVRSTPSSVSPCPVSLAAHAALAWSVACFELASKVLPISDARAAVPSAFAYATREARTRRVHVCTSLRRVPLWGSLPHTGRRYLAFQRFPP